MMTLVWPFVVRVSAKPLVQGFLGAVLGVLVMFGAWKAYGVVRWKVYGRNAERLGVLEQHDREHAQDIQNIVRYLQDAAKGGK